MHRHLRAFTAVLALGLTALTTSANATVVALHSDGARVLIDGSADTAVQARTPAKCSLETPTQVFRQWNDPRLYVLASGGDMETPSLWTLSGAAAPVADNDPYMLSGAGTTALQLGDGGSGTAAFTCVGTSYPAARFMVRNVGTPSATLDVIMQVSGMPVAVKIASFRAGSAWAPSPVVQLPTRIYPAAVTLTGVTLKFVARGRGADFRIDSLFIDPRMAR